MKLTKDMFTTWERVGDEDYNKDFDDEPLHKIFVDAILGFDSSMLEPEEETVMEFE